MCSENPFQVAIDPDGAGKIAYIPCPAPGGLSAKTGFSPRGAAFFLVSLLAVIEPDADSTSADSSGCRPMATGPEKVKA